MTGAWRAVALAAACHLLAPPVERPPSGRPFTPPASWAAHYAAAARCAGHRGHYASLRWYVTDADLRDSTGAALDAQWWPTREVYVRAVLLDSTVTAPWYLEQRVQHEALHDILGTGAHPAAFLACGL